MGNKETRPLSVLVTPASGLQDGDQWVAHCLQLDVVSQGNSIEHAFQMICEACWMAISSDLADGLDPFLREPAPDEAWAPYYEIMKNPVPLSRVPVERRGSLKAIAGELVAVFAPVAERPENPFELCPPAWQLAARDANRSDRASAH